MPAGVSLEILQQKERLKSLRQMLHQYSTPAAEALIEHKPDGVVLLLDGSREDALASLESFMADVRSLNPMPALVVGIGRSPSPNSPVVTQCTGLLEQMGFNLPVFRVDVRRREDVLLLVETLVCLLEAATSEDIA